jgi:hypothetical protein
MDFDSKEQSEAKALIDSMLRMLVRCFKIAEGTSVYIIEQPDLKIVLFNVTPNNVSIEAKTLYNVERRLN